MADTLLPCPFCGGPGRLWVTDESFIECEACGIATPPFVTGEKAVATWNRRTPPGLTINEARAAVGLPPIAPVEPLLTRETPQGEVRFWNSARTAVEVGSDLREMAAHGLERQLDPMVKVGVPVETAIEEAAPDPELLRALLDATGLVRS